MLILKLSILTFNGYNKDKKFMDAMSCFWGNFMDKRSERLISIILYISIIFTFVLSITFSSNNKVILGILSSILIVSTSIRLSILYINKKYRYLGKFLLMSDLAVIYWLMLIDRSGVSVLYILVILIDAILFYSTRFSLFIIFMAYLSFCFNNILTIDLLENYRYLFFSIFIASGLFAFISSILYLTKYQIIQRQKVILAMHEVEEKTIKLEAAYSKLKEHSEALEEMTLLQERNRIAREIHDTVGHTLTTVLIEMEAGKRLLMKDEKPRAIEKIDLAQDQVRKGLNDIRRSVRMLKNGGQILEFLPSLKLLISDTIKHAEVEIDYEIKVETPLPKEIEKTIYNALMEGLTNGIKHGNSKKFNFTLFNHGDELVFSLEDYGVGCKNIIPGFGLTVMKEQIENLKGIFFIGPSEKGGCILSIKLPIERLDNFDKNINS